MFGSNVLLNVHCGKLQRGKTGIRVALALGLLLFNQFAAALHSHPGEEARAHDCSVCMQLHAGQHAAASSDSPRLQACFHGPFSSIRPDTRLPRTAFLTPRPRAPPA